MKNFNSVMQRFALPLCNPTPQNTVENNETLNAYFETLEKEFEVDKSELIPPESEEEKEEDNATK